MFLLETVLVAIGLAMDCFAVSITCGLAHNKITRRDAIKVGIFFGGFQAGMAILGWLGGTRFTEILEDYAHWVAFILLLIIGGKMLVEGLKEEADSKLTDFKNMRILIILSIATSIDSLAIGVSYAFLDIPILFPAATIGLASLGFAYAGLQAGGRLGEKFEGRAEVLGGLILLAIGIKVLVEGMFF